MIKVVRRNEKQAAGAVRFSIGRQSSGAGAGCLPLHALANPYKLAPYGSYSRGESLERYERWLLEMIAVRDPAVCGALSEIWRAARRGEVELECFCAPLRCHGDLVKEVVDARR